MSARLEALTLLDAIDGYLATRSSWTALRLARALIHEHHVESLEVWPHLEEAFRADAFAQRPAGDDGLHSVHWARRP